MIKGEFFLTKFENAINAYLSLDESSDQRMAPLEEKVFAIELLPWHITIYLFFTERKVKILLNTPPFIHATLRGTPIMLLCMMLAKDRHPFFQKEIELTGEVEVGQAVMELFDALTIDWEEIFSEWIGDIPAYYSNQSINKFKRFTKNILTSFTRQTSEYIHEEAKWLPGEEELKDFFHDIDLLRMDTDRCEARFKHLQSSFMLRGKK